MHEVTEEIRSLSQTWPSSYRVSSAHTLTYVDRILHSGPCFEFVVSANQRGVLACREVAEPRLPHARTFLLDPH